MKVVIDGQPKVVTCFGNTMNIYGKDLEGRPCIVSKHTFGQPADAILKMLSYGPIRTNGHKYERY